MKRIEIKNDGGNDSTTAIENTLRIGKYADFKKAQENYYAVLAKAGEDVDFEKKTPRSRHCFSVKELRKLLRGAEFFVVSAGFDSESQPQIRLCFQKIVKNKKDDSYMIDEDKVLSSYRRGGPVHPINGIPNA